MVLESSPQALRWSARAVRVTQEARRIGRRRCGRVRRPRRRNWWTPTPTKTMVVRDDGADSLRAFHSDSDDESEDKVWHVKKKMPYVDVGHVFKIENMEGQFEFRRTGSGPAPAPAAQPVPVAPRVPAGGDVREHPAPEVLPRAPTNFAEVVGARLRRDADENARLRHQLRCLRNGEDGGEDLGEDGGEGVLGGVASLGVCLGMKRPSAASTTP